MEETNVRVVVVGVAHRLLLGVIALFSVDLIWVASSELSQHIFREEKFDKPFFSTYVKTSMFLLFLLGFLFWTPWQDRCTRKHTHYQLLSPGTEVINSAEDDLVIDDETAPGGHAEEGLSPSAYVPVNYDPSSGNESDESGGQGGRAVTFSKLAEVRQMSEKEASEALLARMSYQASLHAEALAHRLANRLGVRDTARLALTFCILWFVANYSYQVALSHSEVGVVNVLSSSSSLCTLLLAAAFPAAPTDSFTLSKLLSVLLSLAGVSVVSLLDVEMESRALPVGALAALVSALFYASYLVFLRRQVDHEDKLDIPMFFGFVGLFNLLLLWPLFFILNYAGIEPFEWPSKRQWGLLLLNGIIGTVFSEVLWLWGCFLTSSLIATLAISLTIPLSMLADVLFKKVSYSWVFYAGAVPMVASFFAVTTLSHYDNWDPVGLLLTKIGRYLSTNPHQYRRVETDSQQSESLLEADDDPHHHHHPQSDLEESE